MEINQPGDTDFLWGFLGAGIQCGQLTAPLGNTAQRLHHGQQQQVVLYLKQVPSAIESHIQFTIVPLSEEFKLLPGLFLLLRDALTGLNLHTLGGTLLSLRQSIFTW